MKESKLHQIIREEIKKNNNQSLRRDLNQELNRNGGNYDTPKAKELVDKIKFHLNYKGG